MNNNLVNSIKEKLINEGYSETAATVTALDLANIATGKYQDLSFALQAWLNNQQHLPNIREGSYSLTTLVDSGMSFPAALISIEWLREDYASAQQAISVRM